jgi:type VI secretion system secreted protein VgrG
LARAEYLALMEECLEQFRSLGEYAAQHNALPCDVAGQAQVKSECERWEHGTNTLPERDHGGAPIIGITAPAGVSIATPQTIVSYAGRNIDNVAQQHVQISAGQRVNLNAGKGVSLFAHQDGINAIAHGGKVLIQSQHDDTDIHAAKNITLSATDGVITIAAKEIRLVAEDGSFTRIGGGITHGTKGDIKNQAANFLHDGPSTMAASLPAFTTAKPDQQFVLKYGAHTDSAIIAPNRRFEIDMTDGSKLNGTSDADGKTHLLERDAMHIASIRILADEA